MASLLCPQAHSGLLAAEAESAEEKETLSQRFASVLTALYAEQQAAVAEQCGVSGGESWRLAFEAASNSGAKQVQTRSPICSSLVCLPVVFFMLRLQSISQRCDMGQAACTHMRSQDTDRF